VNKKTMMVVAITAVVTLVLAPRLKALPGVNRIPTV
jgi:hypothetical protein